MTRAARELVVVTGSFPYGSYADFLSDEIEFLAHEFEQVTVVPTKPSGDLQPVPPNVAVDLGLTDTRSRMRRIRSLLRLSSLLLVVQELVRHPQNWHPRMMIRLVLNVGQFQAVKEWAKGRSSPDVAYTFWLAPTTAGLAEAWTTCPVISRVHGGDLYWERYDPAGIPLQRRAIEQSAWVASVSSAGHDYLQARYPDLQHKIRVARLGITNSIGVAPPSTDGTVRIISVSSLTAVKRPVRIAQSVSEFSRVVQSVEWHHFGDGPLQDDVLSQLRSAPASLSVHLHGAVGHDELLQTVATGPWDVFINLSESEGVPVSLMEAQSAGIPVVATNVGGTSEVVDDQHNVLVPSSATPHEVAQAIAKCLDMPTDLRNTRRHHWEHNFSAEVNYRKFAEELAALAASQGRASNG